MSLPCSNQYFFCIHCDTVAYTIANKARGTQNHASQNATLVWNQFRSQADDTNKQIVEHDKRFETRTLFSRYKGLQS